MQQTKIRQSLRLQWHAYGLLLPAMLILFSVGIYPFYFLIRLSFSSWTGVREGMKSVGLENFRVLVSQDPYFWTSLRITLLFVAIVVVLEIVIGFILALLVYDVKSRIRGLVRALFLIPIVLTPVVSALTYKTLFFQATSGLITYIFTYLLKFPPFSLLGSAEGALIAVIFVDVWHWTPFVMLILLAGLASLPEEPYDAARVDGATPTQVFANITLPLMKPVLSVALLLRTIDAFRTFDMIFALTGGGPGTATTILSLLVYQTAFTFFRMGQGAAIAVILIFLSAIIVGSLALVLGRNRHGQQ